MTDALSLIQATVESQTPMIDVFLRACDKFAREATMDSWPGMLEAFRAKLEADPKNASIEVGFDVGTGLEYYQGKIFWIMNSEHPKIGLDVSHKLPRLVPALVALGHAYRDHGKNRVKHRQLAGAYAMVQALDPRVKLGWNPNYGGTGRWRLYASH